jgi:hypothetical protein
VRRGVGGVPPWDSLPAGWSVESDGTGPVSTRGEQ